MRERRSRTAYLVDTAHGGRAGIVGQSVAAHRSHHYTEARDLGGNALLECRHGDAIPCTVSLRPVGWGTGAAFHL